MSRETLRSHKTSPSLSLLSHCYRRASFRARGGGPNPTQKEQSSYLCDPHCLEANRGVQVLTLTSLLRDFGQVT